MLPPSTAFSLHSQFALSSAIEIGLRLGTPDYSRFNILTRNMISIILAVMKVLKSRHKNILDSAKEPVLAGKFTCLERKIEENQYFWRFFLMPDPMCG
jgi:hypothetical protein